MDKKAVTYKTPDRGIGFDEKTKIEPIIFIVFFPTKKDEVWRTLFKTKEKEYFW